MVYGIGVWYVPVPVEKNKLSIGIYTKILIVSGIGSVDSLHFYIITSIVILGVFYLDVTESW